MKTIRVFEAFAGYGSTAMAMKQLQADYPDMVRFQFMGISEIDKYAIQAYNAAHGDTLNLGDICQINWGEYGVDIDLFTYSFPCQDISAAGLQRGFTEGSGSRSSLLWECQRAIDAKRPKFLLMENVKALMQKKFAPDFLRWREWLESRGYCNYYAVLNAKDYGVPQARQRVFMVSELSSVNFTFPAPFPLERRLKHILEPLVDEKYYLTPKAVKSILDHCARKIAEGCGFKPNFVTVDDIAGSITAKYSCRETDTYLMEPKIVGYTRANDSKGEVTDYHLKDVANTLHSKTGRCGNTSQYVLEPRILTQRRTEEGRELRRQGIEEFKYKELTPREDGVANTLTSVQKDNLLLEPRIIQVGNLRNDEDNPISGRVYDPEGIAPTIAWSRPSHEPKILQRGHGYSAGGIHDIAPALTTSKWQDNNYLLAEYRIRKLTPRECFRLMDVPEIYIDRIIGAGISNSQCYKLAGNSIVVSCLYHIFKQMFITPRGRRPPVQLTLF